MQSDNVGCILDFLLSLGRVILPLLLIPDQLSNSRIELLALLLLVLLHLIEQVGELRSVHRLLDHGI